MRVSADRTMKGQGRWNRCEDISNQERPRPALESRHEHRHDPGAAMRGLLRRNQFSHRDNGLPHPLDGGAAVRPRHLKQGNRGCGQCPHFGSRTGPYRCRTGPDSVCFGGSPVFARAGTRFESHLGHVFSLFRGLWASECAQTVHLWAPSGAFFVGGRCCGRRLLLVVSGSGGAAYSFMARSAANCMTGRWLGERCCLCWFAFLDVMTVHGDVAR